MAVDMYTGECKWLERKLVGATLVGDGNKLISLDQNGQLSLAKASRDTLTVESEFQILGRNAITAPSLVGSTLYVRDQKNIMALDLSAEGNQ